VKARASFKTQANSYDNKRLQKAAVLDALQLHLKTRRKTHLTGQFSFIPKEEALLAAPNIALNSLNAISVSQIYRFAVKCTDFDA
jgi:hypothetical protein